MEQYNLNGSTSTIQERIEELETAYNDALEQSQEAKNETSDFIYFGRLYIGALTDFKKALETIDAIKINLTMLEPGDPNYEKAFNTVLNFNMKENDLKNQIVEITQLAKQNNSLCNRITILLEHEFAPHDEFPKNLRELLNR